MKDSVSWFEVFLAVFITTAVAVLMAFVFVIAAEKSLEKKALSQQQQAQFQAELERQCALAWPLKQDNYEECISE